MKKNLLNIILLLIVTIGFTSCLKENPLYTDYSTTLPIADIPKAPANAATVAKTPTSSWQILDTLATGVDYLTAVHLSAKNHVGDITLKMKIDIDAANLWLSKNPTAGYTLIPDSLYSVPSLTVTIKDAGVFTTGDFAVHINSNAKDEDGNKLFKTHKYILPVSIESVNEGKYSVASNFQTILWYIRIK
jgi:uncharacterized protein DUF1735